MKGTAFVPIGHKQSFHLTPRNDIPAARIGRLLTERIGGDLGSRLYDESVEKQQVTQNTC